MEEAGRFASLCCSGKMNNMRLPIHPSRNKSQAILSFGVFADAHYAEKICGDRYCIQSLDKLRACIGYFNSKHLKMTINLGDSIDSVGDKELDLAYLRDVNDVFSSFKGSGYSVLGNHDVEILTKGEFLNEAGSIIKAPYYSFDFERIHFVILDGNCHRDGSDFSAGNFDWTDAWISSEQIDWLEKDLAGNSSRKSIILCHENLDNRQRGGQLDPHVVRNSRDVRFIMEKAGNVVAVLQGHYHPGMHVVIEKIPYITVSAMVSGSGMESNAYGIVSIFEDNSLVMEGVGRQESLSFG